MESGESVSQGRSEDRAVRGFAILRRLHRRAWAAVLSGAACLVFSLVLAVSALGASAGGTAASREATRPRTNTPTSPPITRPRTSALAPKTAELSDPNRVDPRLVYGGLKPAPAEQSPVLEPNDVNLPAEPPVLVAEEEPSAMERLIAGEIDPNVSTQLKQFGYDVFAAPVLTFAPVTDVPVGPDYVIGPGDSFILTLWGRVDAQFLLQVDRNGQVVVPQVGALRVWGMKFSEMEDYLQHELSRKYSDFKMSVAMDRLRVIRVFVVGEASKPGSYTISSLATVINALVAADHVIIPVETSYLGVSGLIELQRTIEQVQTHFKPDLNVLGFLPTLCEEQRSETREILEEMRKRYKKLLLPAIHKSSDLAYAHSSHMDVFTYRPPRNAGSQNIVSSSRPTREYAELTDLVLKRTGARPGARGG